MKRTCLYLVFYSLIALLGPASVYAQVPDSTWGKKFENYPTFKFKGLFQARYVVSTNEDVDVGGQHHEDRSGTSNSFALKYMRAQVQAKISQRTEVVALVNLADFKNDPKTRVLENAYLKYTFSPKAAITVGQFRPWFGIEETIPADIIKSLDWSNQYSEFGKLGWTSFQIGASIGGTLHLGKMPFQYAVSVVNGNGKNQVSDSDNGKQYMTRLVFGLSKKYGVNIGVNGGVGEVIKKNVYAWGADVVGNIPFSAKWNLDLQLEGKQATNHALYKTIPEEDRASDINSYLVRGVYFLPNLRYQIRHKNLGSIEASCRYEYLDRSFSRDSNPRQTLTPMLGLEFLKDYGARIQIGMQMDRYKHQVANTTTYNGNLFIVQVQSRL
ncbi:porin [Sphingobacterium tabacisoli]|uniref:Porin n=1 Tax=Sphingobacterium tabacisoli TaxID=2044855 RepID=A0ABW5L1F7_9SPHI|nr:porin [Sphingobacterium tabacisoli]